MKLKEGQKFKAVAQGDTLGLPSFYGVEYVSQVEQTPMVRVHERMGVPELVEVRIRIPGLPHDIGVPTLVVRGSIDPLDTDI